MNWLILLVLGIAQLLSQISCESNEILIEGDCASGESVWCESLGSAASCKATAHCYKNVWSQDWRLVGKEKNCIMCHKMLDEVKSALNVDESDVNAAMNLIDANKVCSMAELCATEDDLQQKHGVAEFLLAKNSRSNLKSSGVYCTMCHKIFNAIGDFLDHHLSLLKQLIDGACKLLGPTAGGVCSNYAGIYGPMVIGIASGYLHHQICSSIHFCPYYHMSVFAINSVEENFDCDTCNDAMISIRQALLDEKAVDNFKEYVAEQCAHHVHHETECVAILHGQAENLHSLLLKELAASDRCATTCQTDED